MTYYNFTTNSRTFYMKILRFVGAFLIGLGAIYAAICFIAPSDMNVSASQKLKGTAQTFRMGVTDFNHWQAWSPWRHDTTATYTYKGKPHSSGHAMVWEGEDLGAGSQVIQQFGCDSVVMLLDFGMEMSHTSCWYFTEVDEFYTDVMWTYNGGQLPFWNRGFFWLLGAKELIESDYQEGFKDLEQWVASSPKLDVDPCEIAHQLGL